jgi:hypothetical protein
VLEDPAQIPELMKQLLPRVEADPRLHALSFSDPLRLAEELGVTVTPRMARLIRRALASAVSFDAQRSLVDAPGLVKIQWRPHRS